MFICNKRMKFTVLSFLILSFCSTSCGILFSNNDSNERKQSQNHDIRNGKNGRYVKYHYRQTYYGIKEFSLRIAQSSNISQQKEFDKQCMAFLMIENRWRENEKNEKIRDKIKIALLRWNWLEGDPVLNNQKPIDWYMVYMECIFRK